MTKTQELLEAVRATQGGATDYKLAKLLEVPRTTMHEMAHGRMNADAYAAARIALALNKDPLEVIASIEAENASTEAKRTFWKSFHSGLTQTLFGGVLLLTGGFLMPGQTGKAEAGTTSHNGRLRQRPERRKAQNSGLFAWDRRAA